MFVPETEVLITSEGAELLRRVVTPGEYVIGRDVDCGLRVDVNLVSRQHARLTVNYHDLLLEDLGSSNGTFVNGERISVPTRIFPTQKIQIGTATMELRRRRADLTGEVSLAPATALVRRMLPVEFRGDRKYEIGRVVAHGGMGAILDARELTTGRTVAVKVMLESGQETDLLRFIQEAQITARLEHPNIVPVHELGVDEHEQVFYTMKFVRGVTLKKVLALLADGVPEMREKYPLPALLTIFQKVCDAIAFAHSHRVIHRDLKPENIMLGEYGEVLVMDWGLAKILGEPQTAAAEAIDTALRLQLEAAAPDAATSTGTHTLAGTIMGTPAYMPPEQARGEIDRLDERSDLYALGAILFELLHLRPLVTGRDAMDIVKKVRRSELEWTPAAGQSAICNPQSAIPPGLLAVCRKALALDQSARYASVRELQAEIAAFEAGFATRAEEAGLGRQLLLALKRHKTAALAAALVLLAGGGFGTKAVIEGRRAERALTELKKSAPALLQLAESEAGSQRFASAREKLDSALTLDPALLRARWQRAWVLLALERWSDAADALRLAQQRDPADAKLASILPAVEKLAAAPDAERWEIDAAREVFDHLQTVQATGPAVVFANKLKVGAENRRKLVSQRLLSALGRGSYSVNVAKSGLVCVRFYDTPIHSLDALRGLPVDEVSVNSKFITHLEPLRGMRLQTLDINRVNVVDLGPLRGMPLRTLLLSHTLVTDLSPLKGMPLQKLRLTNAKNIDLTPIAGMPITDLSVNGTGISKLDAVRGMRLVKLDAGANSNIEDGSPLKGMQLESLRLAKTKVSDLSFLQGMPLHTLDLNGAPVSNIAALRGLPLEVLTLSYTSVDDLSPLRGAPLKELELRSCEKIADFSPILTLTQLEQLTCDVFPKQLLPLRESETLLSIDADAFLGENHTGPRPVAEFWAAYDAHQAAAKK